MSTLRATDNLSTAGSSNASISDIDVAPPNLSSQEQDSPNNRGKKRPAPRGTAAYPRKRANKACQVCRARRTKCDNKRPSCSFCEKAGTKCVWAPHDLSSFDPASLAILERFDQLESLIRSNAIQPQAHAEATAGVSPGFTSVPSVQESSQERLAEQAVYHVPIQKLDLRVESVLNWQSLKSIVDGFSYYPSELPSKTIFNNGSLPGLEDLDMTTCNRLLNIFWRNVHAKNPILVLDEVKRVINQVVLNGIGWDAKSCLVLLICALGTISTDFGREAGLASSASHEGSLQPNLQAQQYFSAAQKRLTSCLGRRGILEAQCFFYSGVYLATTMQPEAAWSMFLQAKICCQSFAYFTQDRPRVEDFETVLSRNESWVAEECTYWTCMKSEIELHLELNPPGFRVIDLWYPEKFPDPPREKIADSDESWFFYLAEIALRRLANRILTFVAQSYDMVNPTQLQLARDSAVEFEQEANDWVHSLPSSNELTRSGDDVLNFILKGHLMNCYEFIYWPFVRQSVDHSSRNVVDDEYVRKGLQIAVERLEVNKPGFRHRHHGTYFMIRSCTRSAFVLLAAHFKRNLEDLMPVGWLESIWSVISLLEFWQDELPLARYWRETMTYLMQRAFSQL